MPIHHHRAHCALVQPQLDPLRDLAGVPDVAQLAEGDSRSRHPLLDTRRAVSVCLEDVAEVREGVDVAELGGASEGFRAVLLHLLAHHPARLLLGLRARPGRFVRTVGLVAVAARLVRLSRGRGQEVEASPRASQWSSDVAPAAAVEERLRLISCLGVDVGAEVERKEERKIALGNQDSYEIKIISKAGRYRM